jgi:hypothetical protein
LHVLSLELFSVRLAMSTNTSRARAGILAIAALCVCAARADALVITNVEVVIGPETYDATRVGWTFPHTLLAGQDLVLAQSFNGPPNTTSSYSFDTSDVFGDFDPIIRVTADGVTTQFTDTQRILNLKGVDIPNNEFNEAQPYGAEIIGPGYSLFLAYADNTHTDACGSWAASIGLTPNPDCLPTPFLGATIFDGAGGINPPQLNQTQPNHCDGTGTVANCYEGGVIRIVVAPQVPEPGTMALMLGGGVMILGDRVRRRLRRRL